MIDSKLQAELRAKFNPDGSDLRKYQMRLFDILCYIDDICKKNNIRYWLSSGTCLGAVRHGGFIPWDDDIDVEMLEEDYKKFCEVMKNEPGDRYVFQTYDNDPGYIYPFGKIRDLNSTIWETHGWDSFFKYRGCFVDVFFLVPSNSLRLSKAATWLTSKQLIFKLGGFAENKRSRRILYYFTKCLNAVALPLIKSIMAIHPSGQLRHFGDEFYKSRNYKDLFPLRYISFEDRLFPVPNDYETYLRRLYGDYNAIPEFNKIEVHLNKFELR